MRKGADRYKLIGLLSLVLFVVGAANKAFGQATAFTYQGRLQDAGANANGTYDFQFTLWDSLSGGTQQPQPSPATVVKSAVSVVNGVFTVQLDFGGSAFPGADRFLETSVRSSGGGTFTLLSPRQAITSTPYAVRSASSGNADMASTATNAAQLGGVAANQYVVTSDTRLSDARDPLPGSTNYIQNGSSQQASSNFNVSGNGTAGGTLSGNIINAANQFNIGGFRVFGVGGATQPIPFSNTYVGQDSGTANPPTGGGTYNSFFGAGSGRTNTAGSENSFFGTLAGAANTTGTGNSYFGDLAGTSNTTAGNGSFFGSGAGYSNTTGLSNSFFGQQSGNSNVDGGYNSFFGSHSGHVNVSGGANSFFGYNAGYSNTASNNNFFGFYAGFSNTTGGENNFFGEYAGESNTTGEVNSFFGGRAGQSNTTASNNSFFGWAAGATNTTGAANSFFGVLAGGNNKTGGNNSFFGTDAGLYNTSGLNNTFIGYLAGNPNTSTQVNNSIAIGAGATVSTDNTIVLGTSTATTQIPGALRVSGSGSVVGNFGIGTTTPSATLDVRNNSGSASMSLLSGSGSASLYLTRSAAVASQAAQIGFYSGGTVDFAMGTSQGSAGVSDFSIYNYGTGNNALTIQKSNGNVGIGTTTPAIPLEVRRDGTPSSNWQTGQLRISGSTDPNMQLVLGYDTTSNLGVIQAGQAFTGFKQLKLNPSGGQVTIGSGLTSTGENLLTGTARVTLGLFLGVVPSGGTQSLCLNGSGQVTLCNSSSLRYKSNIRNFGFGLQAIRSLTPVTFNWKESGASDFGLVAEEVEKVEPDLVFYKDGRVEGVRYDRIGVVLINAIKEQQAQIEQQRLHLNQQAEQIKRQEDQASKQRAALAAQQHELNALKRIVCRSHPRAALCR